MERTLGIEWLPSTDRISFNINLRKVDSDILDGLRSPTKREMLRIIVTIYDHLGMLLLLTIKRRILLQNSCRSRIGWDEKFKDEEFKQWNA